MSASIATGKATVSWGKCCRNSSQEDSFWLSPETLNAYLSFHIGSHLLTNSAFFIPEANRPHLSLFPFPPRCRHCNTQTFSCAYYTQTYILELYRSHQLAYLFLFIYVLIRLFTHLFIYCLIYLFTHLLIYLHTYLSIFHYRAEGGLGECTSIGQHGEIGPDRF